MQPLKHVACPRCGAPALYAPENKWRPFCSERCKLIDLGDWAAERYRVPVGDGQGAPDSEEDSGETPA